MNEREPQEQVHQAAPCGHAPTAGLTSQTVGGNTAVNTEVDAPLSREEWMRRYAARIMERAGWPEVPAIKASEVAADEFERMERAAGNAIAWDVESPEWAADEEMSYWENDE